MAARNTASRKRRRAGFSLIEITIVLLIVGIGLVALLGLFPVGLRQATFATSDTAQAVFADQVLNMLHANASAITNWNTWSTQFQTAILKDAHVDGQSIEAGAKKVITGYLSTDATISYKLSLPDSAPTPVPFGRYLRRAYLRVTDRKDSNIDNSPLYCTDFVFMGYVPE